MTQQQQAAWLAARKTRNPVLETMRDSFDGGDPWGSVMAWWFAVCDVISDIDPAQVPAAWEFRQSPMGSDTESFEYEQILETMAADGVTLETLQHAGWVLCRYAAQLKLSGLDY